MIVNKSHEVQEQELGIYIFPDEVKFKTSWALWLWEDGSADVYLKRNPKTGALLGKPIRLPAPERKVEFCTDSACSLMGYSSHEFGNGCRLYKSKD